MKTVPLNNQRLMDLLCKSDSISNDIKKLDFDITTLSHNVTPAFDGKSPYGDEYLNLAMELDKTQFGFPRHSRGICKLHTENEFVDVDLTARMNSYARRITTNIGAERNALFMIYPPGGYIGWHHNGNAPGYNVLFTYNETDQGWFKYRDATSGKVITIQDTVGWSCKAGYYTPLNDGDSDSLFWHAAHNDTWRRTLAFVTPDKEMWLEMIDQIADGDIDISSF